ncbi:ureidoglycolate lyase [Providencia rettgeri]|uniref:ureidoglycolate lyase n=1 Tax=Providencia stuartii TaxID=588 RepID=UPI000CE65D41|nr:ureidoglycolate lyase [Providencia stuartii]AVE40386.1 ureidoglycolate lyase [Providencia stuartii]EMA4784132.1 ureidoglycolate lyase [Providencia rettgeri]UQZ13302.1 ureidoglycolate lyase [Providencia stuartii]
MELVLSDLTPEAFAPYGDVIQVEGSEFFHINEGTTERYHALGKAEITDESPVLMSISRSEPIDIPMNVKLLEKHPLSSQAFIPMNGERFIVVVAEPGDDIPVGTLRAFITNGKQGVNYHRDVWHHPIYAFQSQTDFLTVDRGGADNCVVKDLPEPCQIVFP